MVKTAKINTTQIKSLNKYKVCVSQHRLWIKFALKHLSQAFWLFIDEANVDSHLFDTVIIKE